MHKNRSKFEEYLRELWSADPSVAEEIQASRDTFESTEALESSADDFSLETIVLKSGRPVLDIKSGAAVIDIAEVESMVWKERLAEAAGRLAPGIPAVGRIELANHPRGVDWLGTGWLIRDDIIVTNRHVAEIFGEFDGDEFVFRTGLDGTPMRSSIDFLREFDETGTKLFPLFKVLHLEKGGGPDLAFLRIQPISGQDLPKPVAVSETAPEVGEQVAVIGYPARDPFFPDQALMDQIFNSRYDKKRLAPGLITASTSERVHHDCSTLGGNSGGKVVSLKTGKAVALHFAGTLFAKNHAVPIEVVQSRLDDALRRRPKPAPGAPPEGRTPPVVVAQGSAGRRVLKATIPLHIQIEIGDPVTDGALTISVPPRQPRSPSLDVGDDSLIEAVEAKPEDYKDRKGYSPDFLGHGQRIPLPKLTENLQDTLEFTFEGKTGNSLHYKNFSVVMSASRRMCRFSACNIDGKQSKRTSRSGWQLDPRIAKDAQIMKECYGNPPKFSRGHMTRREDPAWGSPTEADLGNRDSMHVTNTVPQMQPFNAGVWLDLEDYALQNARKDDMRICVFTGPFLKANDPVRYDVKIPVSFWKVIAFIHDQTGSLCATGYTMSQQSFIGEEEFVFGRHENNQRPIHEIERRAGISFGGLADVDPMKDLSEAAVTPLIATSQIRFLVRH